MAGMDGRRLAVVPLTKLQSHAPYPAMIEDAELFIAGIPSDAVAVVFWNRQRLFSLTSIPSSDTGAPGGVWPSSSGISSAMLELYQKKVGVTKTRDD